MIFYEVVRVYRGRRRTLYQGDNRARAWVAYDKAYHGNKSWGTIRDGDLALLADGFPERQFHGGYNRTRW